MDEPSKKKRSKCIAVCMVAVFFVILLTIFVRAEIIFHNDFSDIYSVGDYVYVNFSIEKQVSSDGFVESDLVCDGEELEIYKKYRLIGENEKKNFGFEFPALLEGKCIIRAKFEGESMESEEFKISKDIEISYALNNQFFFPLEEIRINGTAIKKNGERLDGIIKIFIEGIADKTIEVKNGYFLVNFEVAKEISPKEYELVIEAFEKNAKEEIINQGKEVQKIEIRPKPTYIEIESQESLKPPMNFSIKTKLLDQSGGEFFNETIAIKLFDPEKNIVLEESLKNNEEFVYFFNSDSKRGGWEIVAYHGSINKVKPVYVLENKEISVEVIDEKGRSYANIKNIGNIKYEGVVDIFIKNSTHDEKIPFNVYLEVGEEEQYRINYNGIYNLSVDGKEFNNVPLKSITGASIFLDSEMGIISYFVFFTFVLIVIIVLVIKKRNVFGKFRNGILRKILKLRDKQNLRISKVSFKEPVGKQELIEKKSEKTAYIGFFKFDESYGDAEKIAKERGLSFNKIKEGLYFVLFYSKDEKSGLKLFSLAREIWEKAAEKGVRVSIILNSEEYEGRASFLKKLAEDTKKKLSFSNGSLLLTKNIYKRMDVCMNKKWFGKEELFVYD